MEEYLEVIKNDEAFKEELVEEINELKTINIATRAELCTGIFIKKRQAEKALQLAGDTIYNIGIERDHYLSELEKVGEVDHIKVQATLSKRKSETPQSSKNKYILAELHKQNKRLAIQPK